MRFQLTKNLLHTYASVLRNHAASGAYFCLWSVLIYQTLHMRFFSTLLASTIGSLVALVLVVFFGFLILTAIVASTDIEPSVQPGSVLVMNLSGPLPEYVSHDPVRAVLWGGASVDSYDIKHALKKAAVDKRIDAIWLQMRGMRASWGTLQEIREALVAFKKSGKPLYASSGEYMMAERDYFLASVADSVFASPEAFFEFNGLYLEVLYYKGLLDALEIDAEIVRAGEYKAAVEPYLRKDMSEENKEQLSAILESTNSMMTGAIADSRGRTHTELEKLAREAAMLTAADAYEAGLLDSLLFEDEVVAVIKQRLGIGGDDSLHRIRLRSYIQTSDAKAGLSYGNDGQIAIVYAVGTIVSGTSDAGRNVIGSSTFNKAIREARDSDRVKAVVLRINSPGGSATASDAMWREISLTAEEKPVVVSMGDLAASGGYWIATAADTIVADPQTLTGSIGVFGVMFSIGRTLDTKLGITADRVRTSSYADMFSGMRMLEPQERALLTAAVRSTYSQFVDKVADSRGLDATFVDEIGQGRIWTGQQALDLGLVDIIGSLDTAVGVAAEMAGLEEGQYRVRRMPRPKTFLEEFEDALLARVSRVLNPVGAIPGVHQHKDFLETTVTMQGAAQARMEMELSIQ